MEYKFSFYAREDCAIGVGHTKLTLSSDMNTVQQIHEDGGKPGVKAGQ